MDLDAIQGVVDQYAKHGWRLRRVLLSPGSIAEYRGEAVFGDIESELMESENEALWFSRRSLPDREAWELRRLSGSPFALVAVLEDSLSDKERENILCATEKRMFDGSHPEPTSH